MKVEFNVEIQRIHSHLPYEDNKQVGPALIQVRAAVENDQDYDDDVGTVYFSIPLDDPRVSQLTIGKKLHVTVEG